ncbi:conjugal transfer protein TraG N-terminal domain-containing protein [Comamonas odontotermitis]|uniref:conjugal transfer protein TraG N-terminal domain-containing protein n=1 Tax=Comamonas odontotermitis TaxID=379895 RepID=UPI00366F157A
MNPKFGRPTCKQWWETDLREKLVSANRGIRTFAAAATDAAGQGGIPFSSDDQRKDYLARMVATKSNPTFVDVDHIMGNQYDTGTNIGRFATGSVANLGVAKEGFMSSLSVQPLMTALPMIQALVLMGIYTFLPLATFLSGLDLKFLFHGAIAIFTVKLWASMWFIATWIDGKLIKAMYPGALGWHFVQGIFSTENQGDKRIILHTLLIMLFAGLPIIWSSLMTLAGINLGGAIDRMMSEQGKSAGDSGKAGPGVIGKVISLGRKLK